MSEADAPGTTVPQAPAPSVPPPTRTVEIIDVPAHRLRRPGDLVAMILALLGVVLVLLLAVYAHRTTEGVTEDIENALPDFLERLLDIPLNLLEGLVTFLLPLLVIVERLIRRQVRVVLEALAAAVVAALLTGAGAWLLRSFAPDALVDGLAIASGTALSPAVAAIAALLTTIGSRDRRRAVGWSWNLLWIVLVLQVLMGAMSLPGALVSVLLGRALGLAARYLWGVRGERAYGRDLVTAIRRAGLDPLRIQRIADPEDLAEATAELVTTNSPIGYVTEHPDALPARAERRAEIREERGADDDGAPPTSSPAFMAATSEQADDGEPAPFSSPTPVVTLDDESAPADAGPPAPIRLRVSDPATVALAREGENRVYAVVDADGTRWDVVVLDGDRQVVGTLAAFWSTIRLKGLEQRAVVSLRAAAARAALMTYAAAAAGVRAPRLQGIADEEDSVLLVGEHVSSATTLSAMQPDDITDELLDGAWEQLRVAHDAGLAHRAITGDAILVASGRDVWLTAWENGEIAASELARRLDLAQMLALLALTVGPERAMASASRSLTEEQLVAIAPILQPVALPPATRAAARRDKQVLARVQNLLVDLIPTAQTEPMQLARFSARTVVTVTVAVIAGFILLTTLNFDQIIAAVREANPVWMVVAFLLGLLTYLGSAMSLVAFSPEKLPLWRTTLVQVAASVITLVAPAGIGPAALNLRYLQKNRIATPMALATVALVQVSQFVTTVLLLLVIALVTGSSGALDSLPSGAVLLVVALVLVAASTAFAFPAVRRWVLARLVPMLRQVWPRVVWVVGQPGRLAMGIGGNLIMTIGYLAAFQAALEAFAQSVPLTSLAIIYLVGTAAGSAIPTPGGVGTVELALTSGLRTAGVPTAVAASSAVLFRVLTFWGRVPLGWLAMRYLQKRDAI
ncbi:integral membrane protein [Beutenbergia cavernae DSM 12333]|uniref:Integral membrane protein n=1 Tax=Beutenbergia cavernae (strain ATCC BAA-8 / DSM 12333 / CCUG 43141 / JCM 11478 / NBRC 16432 / NCIMB 13614 / HKI 0122) TaxID=471853 RepID=C5C5D3_BEUC1|nr:lysylphosphatidylglycerol synthase transmembrane domain-containing protein [Beutenbergia cavernae]ACQ82273.1 integral membrane protein [Beutenbergia cavernae DSM 12333]